jgi:alkanesulfonate monooxygenase SsuD/methylene tetrahydromethanopterin reductase-like flavin-dependent oxidoreductase (luciferase family)
MRIGVALPFGASDGPGRPPTWREMHGFAIHAEAIGLDSLWVCDHFLSGPADSPAGGIHEGWTIVAALAASTSTIELGQLVMCVSFRSPALLAKMAVTADGVSVGRLVLGLGAGWYDPEYLAFGFPADHRAARFEEALQRLAGMHAALQAESRDPATLRRTVGMDCELTDPGQTGGGSFAGLADNLARAIDAYERLGIDDQIVRLQPSTRPALDRLARAIKIRGH